MPKTNTFTLRYSEQKYQ